LAALKKNTDLVFVRLEILDLLSRRPAINHAPGDPLPPLPADLTTPKLALQNVNFTYPNLNSAATPNLNLTTLSIHRECTTALVGRSGAGKSTIVSLLARLYDPTSGTVLFDGVPLTKIAADTYRGAVALVTQDIHLFQGTLRENILLGVPEYDPRSETVDENIEKRMHDACRQASLHDWVSSLPEGYETLCGQKGRSFSGGQRQRIALARALVRGCEVLILDEATSALDAENERKVYEALAEIEKDGKRITVVVVAHRLATVRKADEIIVLGEGGVVMEVGGHDELTERQGPYWEMYREQDIERQRDGVWI
jgi:ATP-binding cassette subfamily B (MDR/TAP) protein 1